MKTTISFLFILVFAYCFTVNAQTASVIAENANLRGTPNAGGKVVDTLSEGAILEVLQQKGVWFLVQSTDFVGWVHGDTIKYVGAETDTNYLPSYSTPRLSKPRTVRQPTSTGNYIRGPRGGCYYINRNGNKTYVDRSLCN